jgi:hypothetical protein
MESKPVAPCGRAYSVLLDLNSGQQMPQSFAGG